MSAQPETYKISILGSGGVGKTCIVLRLTRSKFDAEYVPTIQDFFEKTLIVDGQTYNLTIIDTAGQEEMQQITDMAIKEAQAYVIVYSVKSYVSFQETEKYYNKVCQLCQNPKVVLCGNMCDVSGDERGVTTSQGSGLAEKWGCPFFETSAKDDINVTQAFEAALKLLLPKSSKGADGGCCRI